jgi:hypothetical protein
MQKVYFANTGSTMDSNETEAWQKNSVDARYNLPEACPFCGSSLKATYVYVGVFPYIHTDFTLVCSKNLLHKFNFCFPYNKAQTMGYTIFDSKEQGRHETSYKCPFHQVTLEVTRFYGDQTFKDGTRKLQLRCPVCFYSERKIL